MSPKRLTPENIVLTHLFFYLHAGKFQRSPVIEMVYCRVGEHSLTSFCLVFVTAAYKHADGKKIDGRRIVVDVERGRTVKTWKPRRLG